MEDKRIEKTKEIREEESVFIDELGRLNIKGQEIFIDEDGNTETVDFRLTKPQNLQMYQKALLSFASSNDYYTFASVLLPKMVEIPSKARKIDFFEHDPEALIEICEVMADFMGKSKEKKKRKLNMKLR
jgi:hypothetical protein|nr:MAG TPA: hypothetical protein [Caudoviricetes sp.]